MVCLPHASFVARKVPAFIIKKARAKQTEAGGGKAPVIGPEALCLAKIIPRNGWGWKRKSQIERRKQTENVPMPETMFSCGAWTQRAELRAA